jgi:uncharacterized protein (TIGR03000 family)
MNKGTRVATIVGVLTVALMAPPAHAQRGGGGGGSRGGSGGGTRGGAGYGGSWGGAGYGGGARGWAGPGYGGAGYYRGGYGGYGYGRGYGYGGIGIGIGINLGGDIGLPGYGGFGYGYDGQGIGIDSGIPYGGAALYGNSNYAPVPYLSQPLLATPPATQQPGGDAPVVSGIAPSVAMQSFYSGPSSSPGTAELTVKVPPNAQLWLGTMLSGQQGPERTFSFPSLQGNNVFSLRCTWSENGQLISRERKVDVKPGLNATVDFTQPEDAKPQAKSAPQAAKPTTPPPLPPTGLPK